jgi:hypothetical protein
MRNIGLNRCGIVAAESLFLYATFYPAVNVHFSAESLGTPIYRAFTDSEKMVNSRF